MRIANVAEFQQGKPRLFTIGNVEIVVIMLPDGDVRAFLNRCPHKGAPLLRGIIGGTWAPCVPGELDYVRHGEVLVCPWHGREFDLVTGEELYQSAGGHLRLIRLDVEDGSVIVEM